MRLLKIVLIRHTAGRVASYVLQCPTTPSLRYNCVADIRWRCVVQSGLQRHTHTMLMATVPSGSCWIQPCHSQFVYGSGEQASVVLDRVPWVGLMELRMVRGDHSIVKNRTGSKEH